VYYFLLSRTDFKTIMASIWIAISLGLLVFIIMLFKYVWHANSGDHIGYLASNLKNVGPALERIIEKYYKGKVENVNLVESGAGFANLSNYLSKKYNWKEIIAVEDEPRIIKLAQFKQRFRKSKINFVQSNVLDFQNPESSLVYCYLLSTILTKMNAKKLFNNCLLVSLSFKIKDLEPTETIEIPGFQKYIFVYDFRKN